MLSQIIICSTILVSIYYIFRKIDDIYSYRRYKALEIIELFEYFLSKSYDITYQNDLIIYITGNQSIPKEQNETIERNYIKQCMLHMGDNNIKMFERFFGSEQTMIIHMLMYIRKRINSDGLTKILQSQLESSK